MTIEDQITALLAEAEPLRLLSDSEAESAGLRQIVDKINYLRGLQSGGAEDADADEVGDQAPPARRPGRPRKADAQ